ncbi:hypothetical protein CABS01_05316 [Colletotrichum abscissum]|uniref:Uncharacterized protein n=1 Tax=Colletotrichum abscissum TaxID=1671311 RepID=A0A9Q0B022_9PEZI|nr:uncharacterized protein CABS01_05316 [Colletotrichum abscissum]KAI3539826.1 hypothetical protein CABS02_11282 [Colletotrichum abscissum]KAK1523695.1 hypothetical protein CABS01_05316 [Colletotrichum abscissum]
MDGHLRSRLTKCARKDEVCFLAAWKARQGIQLPLHLDHEALQLQVKVAMIVMVVNDFVTRINRQHAYAAESSYGRAVPEPLSAHETIGKIRTSFAARNDVPDIGVQPTLRSAVGETSRSSATLDATPSSWWSPVLAQTCPFRSAKDDHPAAVPPTPFTPGIPPRNTPPPPQITITTTTIADSCSASLACLGVTKVSSSTDISLYQTAH